jgi:hypothetical protein
MRNRLCRSFFLAALMLAIFGSGIASAGILGNPSGTIERGNVSFGLEYDYRRGIIDNDVAVGTDPRGEVLFRSQRYLARARLGAFNWMDLFLRLGAADLYFPPGSPGDPRFAGSTRFAIGGGFTLQFFETNYEEDQLNARLLLTSQALRFSSNGNIKVPIPNTTDAYRMLRNEYTWNEIDVGLMLAFTTPSLDSGGKVHLTPYIGVEKSFINGKNDRAEYLLVAGQKTLLGLEEVDFADDGLTIRPVLGLEINAPEGYAVSFEVTILDSDEFSFGVGVSQSLPLKSQKAKERASDYRLEATE